MAEKCLTVASWTLEKSRKSRSEVSSPYYVAKSKRCVLLAFSLCSGKSLLVTCSSHLIKGHSMISSGHISLWVPNSSLMIDSVHPFGQSMDILGHVHLRWRQKCLLADSRGMWQCVDSNAVQDGMFVRGVVKVHHICWHSRWRWRDSPSPDVGGGREVHLSMDSQRVCVDISPVPVKQWTITNG